ncbi:helix-turn-helix transcriptional regulator [Mycobacterium camsae]|uniref:helix-turn-helix transcriptional regulator n=1 Tax=Mycobacterium gordonae TaxID=1778 RepID=UPI0019812DC3|nr:AraC family transcriptional regulator [Mycobacterium gordonae]
MTQATRLSRHRDGVPVYRYRTDPEIPPVSVVRYHEFAEGRPHIHDFPALWYVPEAGAVYVAAPGKVLDPRHVFPVGDGIAVFFDPVALGEDGRSPWPAWQTHPLLFPFLHGQSGGVLRLEVPAERKEVWDRTIASIESELAARQQSYRQATLAHLTLLLIELARLAGDIVDDLRRSGEPLLADVFAVIDRRHGESLSLRDVAIEVGMTPGHLTTVVRRRTGRTVQEWIIERRMAEARDLLAETDLPIGEVARRVGILDAGYFSRLFSRAHGGSPRQWRAGHAQGAVRPAPPENR